MSGARRRRRIPLGVRILLGLVALGTVLVLVSVGVTYAALRQAGSIDVAVQDQDGTHFAVSVPAGLADLAVTFTPRSVLDELSAELAPIWPTVRAAGEGLEEAPDFLLVEVRDADQHVAVRKQGDRLLVEVDADGDRIRLALPLRTIRRITQRLDRSS